MTTPDIDPADRLAADSDYRPCVGIALFNARGAVFLGRRLGESGAHGWQMPQGGIDPGEAPQAAALRELHEETNVAAGSVTLLGQIPGWLSYELPEAITRRAWRGRYRGQAQRWFAFGFLGTDAEIDIARPGGGAHKPEFEAWRWADLAETPALIVPFKRAVYEQVVEAFRDHTAWRGK